jgi:hypothetical protein
MNPKFHNLNHHVNGGNRVLPSSSRTQWFLRENECCVGFGVSTAVNMNVPVVWHIALCSSYKDRRFGETYHLHLDG